jgi:hypothetical protein
MRLARQGATMKLTVDFQSFRNTCDHNLRLIFQARYVHAEFTEQLCAVLCT